MRVRICALRELAAACRGYLPDVVISIGDACERDEAQLAVRGLPSEGVLRLEFADINEDIGEFRAPVAADLLAVEEIIRTRAAHPGARVLVHCSAGLSRSPAVALHILAWDQLRNPPGERRSAEELYTRLKRAAPLAIPHKGIVAMTDRLFRIWASPGDPNPFERLRLEDKERDRATMILQGTQNGILNLW